jgi:hypothetical protein
MIKNLENQPINNEKLELFRSIEIVLKMLALNIIIFSISLSVFYLVVYFFKYPGGAGLWFVFMMSYYFLIVIATIITIIFSIYKTRHKISNIYKILIALVEIFGISLIAILLQYFLFYLLSPQQPELPGGLASLLIRSSLFSFYFTYHILLNFFPFNIILILLLLSIFIVYFVIKKLKK